MENTIKNRYEFILLFDVKDGNPNGDPDAGNLPRVDAETGMGLVTDVCLKRKVRNYIQLTKSCQSPYDIFIKEKAILNELISLAHKDSIVSKQESVAKKNEAAREYMCEKYYDVRSFGAVMSTNAKGSEEEDETTSKKKGKSEKLNAGQVRGPIQLTFSRSIDPIMVSEHTIHRMCVTTAKEAKEQQGDNHTFGRKSTVPYALYKCHGYVSAHLAAQTGFGEDDLKLFWDALINMFDHDHSAARGMMNTCKLIVFKHQTALGNAPAHKLFESVSVKLKDSSKPPRDFSDYEISINKDAISEGVELIEMV